MNSSKHQLEITDLNCFSELSEEETANIAGGISLKDVASVVFPLNSPFDTYQDFKNFWNGDSVETVARKRGKTLIDRVLSLF